MKRPTEQRFWSHVQKTESCWIWTGQILARAGYGRFWVGTTASTPNPLAHRYSYELVHGPIPAGLQLDHLCRNTSCVRPDHLEPVTGAVNIQRGRAVRTHCKNGHPYPAIRKRSCEGCREQARRRWEDKEMSTPEGRERARARNRAQLERLQTDPVRHERHKAQMRLRAAARYQEAKSDPESWRAEQSTRRAAYEKAKADPVKLEKMRAASRLRAAARRRRAREAKRDG